VAVEDLGRRVERWVAAGVIGREQGEAILALEGASAGAGEAGGRRAVVVEVLGYLGGGLALVAGFVLGAESWAELGYWGRAGVLGAVTAVLLGAGWWLRTGEGRVLPRLASVLWLGAAAAFAGLLAVLLGGAATTRSTTRRWPWRAGRWSWPAGCTWSSGGCCSRWRCSGPRWRPC
jgi:hypothetical protein